MTKAYFTNDKTLNNKLDQFFFIVASKIFPSLLVNNNSKYSSSPLSSTTSVAVVLYSVIAFAIQLLHAPFITFFVDFSSRHLNISWNEFVIAQIIYGIWNSSNEFVFGYNSDVEDAIMTDDNNNVSSSSSSMFSLAMKRIRSADKRLDRIQRWGTIWAISFCFLWLPLNQICDFLPHVLLYSSVMIFYGGCFAFVTVQHRSLLVDIAHDESERQKCTLWSSFWGGIGSLSVVAASTAYAKLSLEINHHGNDEQHHEQKEDRHHDYASNSSSSGAFRHWMIVVAGIAVVAVFAFYLVTGVMKRSWREKAVSDLEAQSSENNDETNQPEDYELAQTNAPPQKIVITSTPSSPISEDDNTDRNNNNQKQSPPSSPSCLETLRKVSSIPQMRTIYIVWLLQELCCFVLTSFFVSAVTEIVNYWKLCSSSSSVAMKVNDEVVDQQHHHETILHSIFNLLSGETWITLSVGCSFIIPQVVLIGLLPLVRQHGLDVVIANLFKFRSVFGFVTFLFFSVWFSSPSSQHHHHTFLIGPLLMIGLLLSLRLFTECVCRLQPLVLAAMCDEQNNNNSKNSSSTSMNEESLNKNTNNNESWTASIMGASSLGSKPSQSIAPILGYAILREIQQSITNNNSSSDDHHNDKSNNNLQVVKMAMHAIILYGYLFGIATVPTALGSLLAWTVWPLKRLIGKQGGAGGGSGGMKSESQVV